MDKRRLYKDIAIIRKQIFSITAFSGFIVVCMATLAGQGMDFYLVFRNAIIAIIVFGLLGILLGYMYQKNIEHPLIESYRDEARQRIEDLKSQGPQKLAMPINVSELTPGMRMIDPIQNKDGALLVRANQVVNERIIQILRDNNIAQVKVEAQRNMPTGSDNIEEFDMS